MVIMNTIQNKFSVQVGKEKASKDAVIDMAEYLEEEEVQKLIEAAPTLQNKAFLACLYESGARPEEFLRLTSLDVKIDSKGAIFILRGKTGERRVRIIAFSKLLQQWIEVHPLKQDSCYPLWISDATNYKNEPLGIRGAEKMIREALMKSGLSNKHARLYVLRHSRATHLAKYLTEAQMCTFFGWVLGTKVVRRYVHLSGKDVDNALLDIIREEGEEKEGVQENNDNNNNSNTIGNSNPSINKRKKITMTQFVQRYNSPTDSLSRHFSRPIFSDSYNKIFGEIQYVGILPRNNTVKSGNCLKL
jgi:hypothetical protein